MIRGTSTGIKRFHAALLPVDLLGWVGKWFCGVLACRPNPQGMSTDEGSTIMAQRTNFWDLMRDRTQQDIADHLATKQSVVSNLIANKRGFSPEIARKAATMSGGKEKAATLYLTTQVAALKQKLQTGEMKPENALGSAQVIMRTITKGFRSDELDRNSPEFKEAALLLKKIAEAALDLAGDDDAGSGNDQVAAKSSNPVQRDAQGVRIKDGPPVERDAYGRVVRD